MCLHASHAGLTKTEQKIREAQLSGSEGYSPLRNQFLIFIPNSLHLQEKHPPHKFWIPSK